MFMESLEAFFIVFINSSIFSGDLYVTHLIPNSMHGEKNSFEIS